MAADVSTLVRLLSRYDRGDGGVGVGEEGTTKPDLVTRDLLGGCCVVGGGAVLQSAGPKKVAFPDLHLVPAGEKRIQQSMDLNLPPLWSSAPLPPVRMTALENSPPTLDLRLRSMAPAPPPPPAEYQSVCTLEKVKSALERAERETRRRQQRDHPPQPRRVPAGSASPTSSSTTTSSAKRRFGEGGLGVEEGEGDSGSPLAGVAKEDGGNPAAEMAAAGCPSCLMYVLVSRSNPRCPRCTSAVPLQPPPTGKKPRIDLNASASSAPAPSSSPIRTVKFF